MLYAQIRASANLPWLVLILIDKHWVSRVERNVEGEMAGAIVEFLAMFIGKMKRNARLPFESVPL